MNPARGEIWLYERAERKPRPVAILSRDEAIGRLNRILVVPATTSGAQRIPTHVWIGEADGMKDSCALTVDNTYSAPKALLTHRLTKLGPERMAEVCRALETATACD